MVEDGTREPIREPLLFLVEGLGNCKTQKVKQFFVFCELDRNAGCKEERLE